MGNISRFASLLIAALLLSSCAATDCDPTTGGFIGGIRCDASGGYDKRIQEREDQHAALLTRKADLIREQHQIEAERRQAAGQLRLKLGDEIAKPLIVAGGVGPVRPGWLGHSNCGPARFLATQR